MSEENIQAALTFAEVHARSEVLIIEQDGLKASVLITHDENGAICVPTKPLIDAVRQFPERRKGSIEADDLDSFVYLVNRDKRPSSVIFSSRDSADAPYIEAILDFHGAGAGQPSFCEDRISYGFPLSDEWKAWMSRNGSSSAMGQGPFAAFIEDHIFDIGEPSAAGNIAQAFATKLGVSFAGPQALMAVSRGLEIRSEQRLKEARNLENGDTSLVFETTETSKDGGALNIPSAFHIMIPIFKGGPVYSIPVRLRRRTQSGMLSWFFEVHRSDLFLDDAINDALERVRGPEVLPPAVHGQAGCGLPVVMGTPP